MSLPARPLAQLSLLSLLVQAACGPAPAPAVAPPPAPPPAPVAAAPEPLGPGCEEAKSKYLDEQADHHAPPGSASDALLYGAMLNKGAFLDACQIPPSVGVSVCAAVREGRAVGVTVTTQPPDDVMIACIASRIRALEFPSRPGMDITRTRFAPN
jgi:hypothetical protein